MKVLLLAAGAGTRLQPLTNTTPKPLLPVRGVPLIQRLVEALVASGLTDLVINLYHLGEQIEAAMGDGHQFGASIVYSKETEALETGGGIVNALPLLENGDGSPFIIVNADILTDFDFRQLPKDLGDDLAHLVLTPTPTWRSHGDFDSDRQRVTRRGDAYVYCGIAVVSPQLFAGYNVKPFSWNEPMFAAVAAGRVSAQVHTGAWLDIGSPAQYEAAQRLP